LTPASKRSAAEKVRRRVARRLAGEGFARTKPTFWTRPAGAMIEFVHLHLYSFEPRFRVHIGVRVRNDPFEAVALNGPASHPTDHYPMDFNTETASLDQCADSIARYCQAVGEPWWRGFRASNRLLGADSPLDAPAQSALTSALRGAVAQDSLERTRSLLGVV
jgi:hypothetical protein